HVHVARDERTLGDDGDGKPSLLGERLENTARDAESPLGGLVGIRRRPDHDRFSLERPEPSRTTELAAKDRACFSLDEDAALERETRRQACQLLPRPVPRRAPLVADG